MLAIEAKQVSKIYKGTSYAALSTVYLNVEPGQIFTLLGRNGAGKTTFVRICATQLMPTAGSISVLGYDVVKEPGKVRNIISIVPQEGRPLEPLLRGIMYIIGYKSEGKTKINLRKRQKKFYVS